MTITKAGTSATIVNEDNDLSLDIIEGMEDTPENREKLSELSNEKLKSLENEASSKQNYEVAIIIRDILKNKGFVEEETNDASENELKDTETKEQFEQEKEKDKEKSENKIEELKKQLADLEEKNEDLGKRNEDLEGRVKTLEELVRDLEVAEKRNREENSKLLKEIKKAKNSGNKKKLRELKGQIEKLTSEKKELKDKFAGELPKYNSKEIAELKTRWIKFVGKTKVDGLTLYSGLGLRSNIRSRYRINKTVRMLNSIGNDPKKGVNYIMTKASLLEGGKIGTLYKKIRNFFTIRDTKTFDEVFNKHKKRFIDDLESKMDLNSMSDDDKKTIAAIKARLDYYQKAYKRQFIVV